MSVKTTNRTGDPMFCFQCQEAMGNQGCTKVGMCGKTADLAALQDLMIYATKGISQLGLKADEIGRASCRGRV